jgi:hypothetical protein
MDASSLVIHCPRHGYLVHSNHMLNTVHEIISLQLNDYMDELSLKSSCPRMMLFIAQILIRQLEVPGKSLKERQTPWV